MSVIGESLGNHLNYNSKYAFLPIIMQHLVVIMSRYINMLQFNAQTLQLYCIKIMQHRVYILMACDTSITGNLTLSLLQQNIRSKNWITTQSNLDSWWVYSADAAAFCISYSILRSCGLSWPRMWLQTRVATKILWRFWGRAADTGSMIL